MTHRALGASSTLACCLLLASCADCGDSPRPPAEPQPPEPGAAVRPGAGSDDEAAAELRRLVAKPPSGPAVSADVLASKLPDHVGSFVSQTAVEQHTYDLGNGGRMTSIKRDYVDIGDTLAVEIVDASHAPLARAPIAQMQGKDRSTDDDVFRGAVMRGFPGIVQWSRKTRLARAGVVIADRFVVSAEVGPSEDERPAEKIMNQLDLSGIIALADEADRAAEAPPAVEGSSTPAPESTSP